MLKVSRAMKEEKVCPTNSTHNKTIHLQKLRAHSSRRFFFFFFLKKQLKKEKKKKPWLTKRDCEN